MAEMSDSEKLAERERELAEARAQAARYQQALQCIAGRECWNPREHAEFALKVYANV